MKSMTAVVASTATSPVDLFQFSSDSEDYEFPSRGQAALILLGTAVLAVPVGIVGLTAAPLILGVRAVRGLLKGSRVDRELAAA